MGGVTIVRERVPAGVAGACTGAFVEFCAFALLYQPCPGLLVLIDNCYDAQITLPWTVGVFSIVGSGFLAVY